MFVFSLAPTGDSKERRTESVMPLRNERKIVVIKHVWKELEGNQSKIYNGSLPVNRLSSLGYREVE